jgi:hypothetical protein
MPRARDLGGLLLGHMVLQNLPLFPVFSGFVPVSLQTDVVDSADGIPVIMLIQNQLKSRRIDAEYQDRRRRAE